MHNTVQTAVIPQGGVQKDTRQCNSGGRSLSVVRMVPDGMKSTPASLRRHIQGVHNSLGRGPGQRHALVGQRLSQISKGGL